MRCEVNGELRETPDGSTVADLLKMEGLGNQACAVEVNKALIPKRSHADTSLSEGDTIEIVTLVGGG
jgi:sulfur carrier protein